MSTSNWRELMSKKLSNEELAWVNETVEWSRGNIEFRRQKVGSGNTSQGFVLRPLSEEERADCLEWAQKCKQFARDFGSKRLADETAVVPLEDIQVDESLNYIEKPIAILDRKTKALRNKEIGMVKVQWQQCTWEPENEMREQYPELFENGISGRNSGMGKGKGPA